LTFTCKAGSLESLASNRRARCGWILDWKSESTIEWVKRCPNPMPGPFDIEIRQLFEIEDFAEDNVKT
jgi:hypothetical protein